MMTVRVGNANKWACLLAYVTGLVESGVAADNEYLAAETRHERVDGSRIREICR